MTIAGKYLVPQWYQDAKAQGESAEQLKQRIRDFVAEVGKRRGLETHIEPEVIDMTYDSYEYALRGK
jgi:hypothetical protein